MQALIVTILPLLSGCAPETPDSSTDVLLVDTKATVGEICDGEDNDGDGMSDEGCEACDLIVTRTRAWWSTKGCVIGGASTGSALFPVTAGGVTYTTTPSVLAALATNQTMLLPALAQQTLVARLNTNAFFLADLPYDDWNGDGLNETVGELLATADALYTSGSMADRQRMRNLLTTLNSDGMNFGLWFDPMCHQEPEVCDGWDNDGDGNVDESCACDPDAYTYSFAEDVQPIFDANCIGCHSDYPEFGYYAPWGLDLNAGLSYGNLVNVAAGGLPTMDRVEPGDVAASYIVHKLNGTQLLVGGQGDQMPQYGPYLDEATIGVIETWIDEGAPLN